MAASAVLPNAGKYMEDDKSCLLALNRIPGIGPRLVAKLRRHWPQLSDLFRSSLAQLLAAGLKPALAERLVKFDFTQIDIDLAWEAQAFNHHIVLHGANNYPELLNEIPDPPLVLYVKGAMDFLHTPSVAIVGTRKPSAIGSINATQFAQQLAAAGLTVVSGLALGIDAQAHQGAIAAAGKTVAVLATGVDLVYPRRHGYLAQKISENGALISEFPLKSPPTTGHFPRRNRIISGLTLATLVVEAALKSGSLITARYAVEQNREVLAIPGSIQNQLAQGCHQLLQQGAKLVTSCADILDELNFSSRMPATSPIESPAVHSELLKYLGFEVTSIDQLISRSGWSLSDVLCDLAKLELDGTVSAVPGGYMRLR